MFHLTILKYWPDRVVISKIYCLYSGLEELSMEQHRSGLKLMESSTQESCEGFDPDELIKQSMESEITICGKEIELFKSVSKKSKKWYKDYGFEEIDNAKTLEGKWARCPSISWTLCLSMINMLTQMRRRRDRRAGNESGGAHDGARARRGKLTQK